MSDALMRTDEWSVHVSPAGLLGGLIVFALLLFLAGIAILALACTSPYIPAIDNPSYPTDEDLDIIAYIDKRLASRQGLFETTVTDHFEHYVRPQENCAHADTRWMLVSSIAGQGLLAVTTGKDFSFNCSHFTPKQLTDTAHDYELTPMKETCVNLDMIQSGIGSNSCGPALYPHWRLSEKEFDFSVRLMPVFAHAVDPFEEIERA